MFIGHFAVGLAAKKVAPKVSLGTLQRKRWHQKFHWDLLLHHSLQIYYGPFYYCLTWSTLPYILNFPMQNHWNLQTIQFPIV